MSLTIMEYFTKRAERKDLVTFPPESTLKAEDYEKIVEEISAKGTTITVTFKPELHERWNPKTLTRILEDIFVKYRKRYSFKLILIGDYSDVGRYHMHGGLLAPPKMFNSLSRKLPREIGRTELRQVKWSESWARYCVSEPETMNSAKTMYKKLEPQEIIYIT